MYFILYYIVLYSNTRRPKKEVIHYRRNAKRLRHGGRLEESKVSAATAVTNAAMCAPSSLTALLANSSNCVDHRGCAGFPSAVLLLLDASPHAATYIIPFAGIHQHTYISTSDATLMTHPLGVGRQSSRARCAALRRVEVTSSTIAHSQCMGRQQQVWTCIACMQTLLLLLILVVLLIHCSDASTMQLLLATSCVRACELCWQQQLAKASTPHHSNC
jgi:uncharacterized integral membrane protein